MGDVSEIVILATTDFHGWIEPAKSGEPDVMLGGLVRLGAAERAERARIEASEESRPWPRGVLLVDSGDMWTGPALSTLLKGAPVVEAFNALHYDAVALGNHEFDFGRERLKVNARAQHFPILSANVEGEDGAGLDFVRASTVIERAGRRIGIIGLSTIQTPQTTFPKYVKGLRFNPYIPAVRREAAALLDAGADFLIVIAHVPLEDLIEVAEATADLPIRVFLGGHNHKEETLVLNRDPDTLADDVILLTAGRFGRTLGRIRLRFEADELIAYTYRLIPIRERVPPASGVSASAGIPREARGEAKEEEAPARGHGTAGADGLDDLRGIIERAHADAGPTLDEVVAVLKADCPVGARERSALGEVIARSWLLAFPDVDVAMTNHGGIRQDLHAGPVTYADILGVLPFDNHLVEMKLTGAQIRRVLEAGDRLHVAGLRYRVAIVDGRRRITHLVDDEGKPIEEDRTYRVMTTDFLYTGGDHMSFAELDPHARFLDVHMRDPFLKWLRAQPRAGAEIPPARALEGVDSVD